jgi:hypothetical protein
MEGIDIGPPQWFCKEHASQRFNYHQRVGRAAVAPGVFDGTHNLPHQESRPALFPRTETDDGGDASYAVSDKRTTETLCDLSARGLGSAFGVLRRLEA